jgi:signal peptidase I
MEMDAQSEKPDSPEPKPLPPVWTGRVVFAALMAAALMKVFLFDFMIAQGRSMLPVIKPGDILLVIKTAYGIRLPWSGVYLLRWALPKQGDVVVFYTPLGETAVKRCAVITENYGFIALGDNSLESFDSRSYGPVPLDRILGKVFGTK